jgi:DNA-binding YbaB/EbfC family protein
MRDLMGIMKQAQAMQQKVQAVQEELDRLEVEGSSGGGMVKVVLTAKGQAKSLRIDPSLLVPDEAEIVEDLVVAALNDARQRPTAPPRRRWRRSRKACRCLRD